MDKSMAKKLIIPIIVVALSVGIVAFLTASQGVEEKPTITITVSAASSLTEAFTDIAKEFEGVHPGTNIELNLAGSGTLRTQIESGAPADVFASASESDMDLLSDKNLIDNSSRKDFASNVLVMVVPEKDNSGNPKTLQDLTTGNVEKISIGDPETAPVGKYTKQALEKVGLWNKIESKIILGENVKQVLTYVEMGEVDAGFVYITDAESGRKEKYEIACTVSVNKPISYPIAVVNGSKNKEQAQEFVNFVTGTRGQKILAKYGFKMP